MTSIRRQLVLRLIVWLTAATAVGGLALFFAVRAMLIRQFDDTLSAKAATLAALTFRSPAGVEFEPADEFLREFDRRRDAEYFQIWLADGRVLQRSGSLAGIDLARPATDESSLWNLPLPDGRSGRALSLRYQPRTESESEAREQQQPVFGGEGPVTLVVARSREDIDRPLSALAAGLLGVGVFIVAGMALVVRTTVRRGLRPLADLGRRVESIDAASLASRFPTHGMPRELQPIIARLNELLARLQEAFARERRFSSSAAHELRTPIAELRTLAEVALKWPEDASAQQQRLTEVIEITQQMERMVAALLSLARADADGNPLAIEPVALDHLLTELWPQFQERAARKHLDCWRHIPAALVIDTDRRMIEPLLVNLLDNAVEYCPFGGHIDIHTEQTDGRTALVIANTQDSLGNEDLANIFEPFWRKDASHTDAAHSGLGLALVRSLASRLDVEVTASLPEPTMLSIRLRFP